MSIIRNGDTNLDEYDKIIIKIPPHIIEEIDKHKYSVYPIGTSLLSTPIIFILDKFFGKALNLDLNEGIKHFIPGGIEIFIGSIFIALSSVIIYLICRLKLVSEGYSLLLVFIFAFCTSSWSIASRALWQHGPSIFLLCMSLWLYLLSRTRPWIVQFLSIPLAFSYVVRPTNSISIFMFTILVAIQYRKYFFPYCLWSLVVSIPFLIYNLNIYGSILSPYYSPNGLLSNPDFGEALAANLFSPARGLFFFSPVFLFVIVGILFKIRNRSIEMLDYFLVGIISMHLIIISSFGCWWAGHSFGPRFLSDMIPYLIYFLIPVVQKIPTIKGVKKLFFVGTLLVSIGISFCIHYRGATDWDVVVWNSKPINVDSKPSRVWDWHDIQFMRGIK